MTLVGNTKAGLVGPAFCFATFKDRLGFDVLADLVSYITSARFSSSCCRTGMEQPDISTRPAASIAAWGETP